VSLALAVPDAPGVESLETLYEASGLPVFALGGELTKAYGGSLGFTEPRLYANFVASLDGVVSIPGVTQSSHLIAAGSDADRFVMGLLRACADVVLIGAGTLRDSPRSLWTPEYAYPPAGALYAALRRRRNRPPVPTLAVLSGSGWIDTRHRALRERALVLTSEQGAARLGRDLPRSTAIVPIGASGRLEPLAVVEVLRSGGHGLILCEGGPTLLGALAADGLVDELFLTISPLLAGRTPQVSRLALIESGEFLPGLSAAGRLLSVRRSRSHLFARYALAPPTEITA
jgi:riboflavin biosynthesis pyrimidine reductase